MEIRLKLDGLDVLLCTQIRCIMNSEMDYMDIRWMICTANQQPTEVQPSRPGDQLAAGGSDVRVDDWLTRWKIPSTG